MPDYANMKAFKTPQPLIQISNTKIPKMNLKTLTIDDIIYEDSHELSLDNFSRSRMLSITLLL